ncbi:uncharacterized protein [Gorilla gorilla gorilla]|uniref:uncharacterized protein isoform X3 n=1 Tax=Gorilla gorilla gorilla TaxID=9595 RepID=UPI002445F5AE|nr:uncharacterized protein LOC115931713 isoform X3 [Gorilla gorilla gorilla]XP_055229556.1 uncharacterized protein LOC115931713 isoform X3 [Gorilla gorilla gorilla]
MSCAPGALPQGAFVSQAARAIPLLQPSQAAQAEGLSQPARACGALCSLPWLLRNWGSPILRLPGSLRTPTNHRKTRTRSATSFWARAQWDSLGPLKLSHRGKVCLRHPRPTGVRGGAGAPGRQGGVGTRRRDTSTSGARDPGGLRIKHRSGATGGAEGRGRARFAGTTLQPGRTLGSSGGAADLPRIPEFQVQRETPHRGGLSRMTRKNS